MNRCLVNTIDLSRNAYCNLIRSVVEAWPKESTGYLIGSRQQGVYHTLNAYPVQTADRKLTEVKYGNHRAIKRLRRLEKVWAVGKSRGLYLGGFHGHMLENSENTLSESDIDFINGEMRSLGKEKWIEIILNVQNKDYLNEQDIGENIKMRHRKLNVRICDEHFHGYKITLSAYLVNSGPEVNPLTVRIEDSSMVKK